MRHFPDGAGVRQVSRNGGRLPSWRRDGKELFYIENRTLVGVSVETNGMLKLGTVRRLASGPGLNEVSLSAYFYADQMYAVSDDGRNVLFSRDRRYDWYSGNPSSR